MASSLWTSNMDILAKQDYVSLSRNSRVAIYAAVGYVVLARLLRYSRANQLQRKYGYYKREDLKKMTAKEAWEIQKVIFQLEFPFTSQKALEFALFRTYGIPTISKILNKTNQLAQKEHASRRYADTAVLIGEFMAWEPDAPRTKQAIARMNYLHSVYQKGGHISNDDMLYTLGLFALEPGRWIAKYEWRSLNDMEKCAFGVFWKSIGDAMGISYTDLKSPTTELEDGLQWLDELAVWSEEYESKVMVPDEISHKVANETTDILLWDIPEGGRAFGRNAVSALMDTRLRKAMMYAPPPAWLQSMVVSGLSLRKYILRYFALPRLSLFPHNLISDHADKNGRYFRTEYESEPWYVKPTLAMRWGPQAWIKWSLGKPIPGDEGDKYQPQGYVIEDVGPKLFVGKGRVEYEKGLKSLEAQSRGGCPFGNTSAVKSEKQ